MSEGGSSALTSCSISASIASSSYAAAAVAERLHCIDVLNDLAAFRRAFRDMHCCTSRGRAALMHFEEKDLENIDVAAEAGPLLTIFSIGLAIYRIRSGRGAWSNRESTGSKKEWN